MNVNLRRLISSNRIKQTKAYKGTAKMLKEHGRDIFSILAGIGVIATGVSAFNAGLNAAASDNGEDEQQVRSKILLKPIIIGTGTLSCIGGAWYFGRVREEALIAAGAILSAYASRRQQNRQDLDLETDVKQSEIEDTGTGEIIFVEDFTGRRFKSSYENVEDCIKELGVMFKERNFVCLNDFYSMLGLPTTSAGDVLGWSVNMNILDRYLDEDDYEDMKDALTDLDIFIRYYEGIGYVIHYPYIPYVGRAGVGPCNH